MLLRLLASGIHEATCKYVCALCENSKDVYWKIEENKAMTSCTATAGMLPDHGGWRHCICCMLACTGIRSQSGTSTERGSAGSGNAARQTRIVRNMHLAELAGRDVYNAAMKGQPTDFPASAIDVKPRSDRITDSYAFFKTRHPPPRTSTLDRPVCTPSPITTYAIVRRRPFRHINTARGSRPAGIWHFPPSAV